MPRISKEQESKGKISVYANKNDENTYNNLLSSGFSDTIFLWLDTPMSN